MTWLPTPPETQTPEEGFGLATKMSRMAVKAARLMLSV